jgi:hypothetical protein
MLLILAAALAAAPVSCDASVASCPAEVALSSDPEAPPAPLFVFAHGYFGPVYAVLLVPSRAGSWLPGHAPRPERPSLPWHEQRLCLASARVPDSPPCVPLEHGANHRPPVTPTRRLERPPRR